MAHAPLEQILIELVEHLNFSEIETLNVRTPDGDLVVFG